MTSIVLPPSSDDDALVKAILTATAKGLPLDLQPGTHFTKPGHGLLVEIGANGLNMSGPPPNHPDEPPPAIVARPDRSIDLQHPDENIGLYLVPSGPTRTEIDSIVWQTHQPLTGPPFEFGIVIRGDVTISNINLNCNMGNQCLDLGAPNGPEHSAMLAFAGRRYNPKTVNPETTLQRAVFVGFRSVTLTSIQTSNGAIADDITFRRGYFTPNIENVTIERVRSANRLNRQRATVDFTGLCQNITIHDIDVFNLHLEETNRETYDQQPRPSGVFKPSSWSLSDITADRVKMKARGHVYTVNATSLNVKEEFAIANAGGFIENSTLSIVPDTLMSGLNDFRFDNIEWHFRSGANGKVVGFFADAKFAPCAVSFQDNRFIVEGTPKSGNLIFSEYTGRHPVTISAIGCTYPEPFGRSAHLHIAFANELGTWTFARLDLGDRDPNLAVRPGTGDGIDVEFV